jgi:hypothetical protein
MIEEGEQEGSDDGMSHFWAVFEPQRKEHAKGLCSLLGWKIFTIDAITMHYSISFPTKATTTSPTALLNPFGKG